VKLCVALDLPSKDENLNLIKELKEFDTIWLKVGLRSYIRDGKDFIKEIKKINPNFKIFLDLKLYDIPNTMADASEEIAKLGIDMFNVHASSGVEAMSMVMQRLQKFENRPLVLAVTALTSFSEDGFNQVYSKSIDEKAKDFAIDTFNSKLDGVVSSVYESKLIKSYTNSNFITLTPGIRPFGESSDDQNRVATIDIAKNELVDFIVVGRPIYKATNPKEVVKKILEEL
jgi:orotidine-5'-phosphate decarboxylase